MLLDPGPEGQLVRLNLWIWKYLLARKGSDRIPAYKLGASYVHSCRDDFALQTTQAVLDFPP